MLPAGGIARDILPDKSEYYHCPYMEHRFYVRRITQSWKTNNKARRLCQPSVPLRVPACSGFATAAQTAPRVRNGCQFLPLVLRTKQHGIAEDRRKGKRSPSLKSTKTFGTRSAFLLTETWTLEPNLRILVIVFFRNGQFEHELGSKSGSFAENG
jgi:hypothetical protein